MQALVAYLTPCFIVTVPAIPTRESPKVFTPKPRVSASEARHIQPFPLRRAKTTMDAPTSRSQVSQWSNGLIPSWVGGWVVFRSTGWWFVGGFSSVGWWFAGWVSWLEGGFVIHLHARTHTHTHTHARTHAHTHARTHARARARAHARAHTHTHS